MSKMQAREKSQGREGGKVRERNQEWRPRELRETEGRTKDKGGSPGVVGGREGGREANRGWKRNLERLGE